jgi:hypothetical protein
MSCISSRSAGWSISTQFQKKSIIIIERYSQLWKISNLKFHAKWPISSQWFAQSWSICVGNSWSKVSRNASLSMQGNNWLSNALDSSIQGLVFTSINHTLNSSSKMKSNPKISKQLFRWFRLIFFLTQLNTTFMSCFITDKHFANNIPLPLPLPWNSDWLRLHLNSFETAQTKASFHPRTLRTFCCSSAPHY